MNARLHQPGQTDAGAQTQGALRLSPTVADWAAACFFGSIFVFAAVSPFAIAAIIMSCNLR